MNYTAISESLSNITRGIRDTMEKLNKMEAVAWIMSDALEANQTCALAMDHIHDYLGLLVTQTQDLGDQCEDLARMIRSEADTGAAATR